MIEIKIYVPIIEKMYLLIDIFKPANGSDYTPYPKLLH